MDNSGGNLPENQNELTARDPIDGGDVTVAMGDAPQLDPPYKDGVLVTPNLTTYAAMLIRFRTYLVVQYSDDNSVDLPKYNNNPATPWPRASLFTIGYIDWSVDFYSTRTQVLDPYGIVVNDFVRSNIDIFNTKPPRVGDGLAWSLPSE